MLAAGTAEGSEKTGMPWKTARKNGGSRETRDRIRTAQENPGRCGAGFTLRTRTHTTAHRQKQAEKKMGSVMAQSL